MKQTILVAASLLLLATPSFASVARPVYPLCADEKLRSCVENGNTFWYGGEFMRLENVNPPEPTKQACAPEVSTAVQAAARLKQLLNSGEIFVFRYGTDGDGHTLTRVISQGRDVGETLIGEHLAQPNSGANGAFCG
ncbi:MAG: hypothetical protein ABIQ30_04985 [Devosia sp.]